MSWFYNLKISAKLLIGFILVATIAGILGIIGVINIKSEDTNYSELYEQYGVAQGNIGQVAINYQLIRSNMRDIIIAGPNEDKTKYVNNIKQNEKDISNYMSAFEKSIKVEAVRSEFNKLNDALNKFDSVKNNIIQLATADKDSEAVALMQDALPLANAVQDSVDNLIEQKTSGGNQASDDLSKNTNNVIAIMVMIIIIAAIAAVVIGIVISRIISKPIQKLVDVAEKISIGDLDVEINIHTKDEVGILGEAFKKMSNYINEVMTNINSAAEQVAIGSKQVSASSVQLSQGATEQASSIEQLTASIEEISAQTKLNAENASAANELAEDAKENAAQGNSQMKNMLTAMESINESSSSISKIIKVIDEIAFQTNILALNAAVEAARAGQHGKGFAVVAEEVRNLAARSANAAKETTAMIEGSIKKVEDGTRIATETAEALNRIVDGIAKVANIVGDIAIASKEQSGGISQINQGIMQVSQVVQTNASTSEESAAASEELASQAQVLRGQVAKFKLKKTSYYTHNGMNELSPEMVRMLSDMSANKKMYSETFTNESHQESDVSITKPKSINLSDSEFGKY